MTSDHRQPLTAESVKATQALIEDAFGMTDDLYRSSTYLAQNDGSFFCEAPPTRRKGILAEGALGRNPIWPRALEAVRKDKRAAESAFAGLVARIEQAEQEMIEKDAVAQRHAIVVAGEELGHKLLKGTERRLEALTEQHRHAEQRVSERRAAEAEHQAAEQKRQQLREQAEAAQASRESIMRAQEHLAGLADADDLAAAEQAYSEARAEYDRQAFERETLEAAIDNLERARKPLMDDWHDATHRSQTLAIEIRKLADAAVATCSQCEQTLPDDARRIVLEKKRDECEALVRRSLELGEALDANEAETTRLLAVLNGLAQPAAPSDFEVTRAREQVTERARIEERIAAWQRAVTAVDAPEFTQAALKADIAESDAWQRLDALPPIDQAEIARIQQQTLEARAQVNEQRQRLDDARQEKARLEAQLERLQQVEAQASVWRIEASRFRDEITLLALLERAYGRDGIPSLIVEAVAIPVIEAEANRILAELGTLFRVELRTQREKKDGDLTDALDVVVVDEHGCERDYLSYSGGEKTRLAISLRVAFAVYMATSGAGSRTLIVDEPEGLDEAGMAALADVMRRLGGVFERQLLVSHVPALKDAFDSVIHVVREDGRSRIEQAAAGFAPVGVAAGVAA